MKNLKVFQFFKVKEFTEQKDLVVTAVADWKEYSTGKVLGSKVTVVIIRDDTDYGREGNNLYEKFTVRVPHPVEVPIGAMVKIKNATGSVWGEYQNKLTVTAEDIVICGGDKNA